jgi:hypothetical protein
LLHNESVLDNSVYGSCAHLRVESTVASVECGAKRFFGIKTPKDG